MYKVISEKAPYFKWRQNTIKAKDGTLNSGFKVSGSKFGEYLVLDNNLSGDPPHVMYLKDLENLDITSPPVNEVATITLVEKDGKIRIFKEI